MVRVHLQVYTESTLVEQSTPVALQFQDRDLGYYESNDQVMALQTNPGIKGNQWWGNFDGCS